MAMYAGGNAARNVPECAIPECRRPRYESDGITHIYCSRSHAREASVRAKPSSSSRPSPGSCKVRLLHGCRRISSSVTPTYRYTAQDTGRRRRTLSRLGYTRVIAVAPFQPRSVTTYVCVYVADISYDTYSQSVIRFDTADNVQQ